MNVYPTGTCFEDVTLEFARRVAEKKSLIDAEFFMVHGICHMENGEPYAHAWIEEDGWVWMPGIFDGYGRGFGKVALKEFYESFQVTDFTRYGGRQLLAMAAENGDQPPPWEEKYLILTREYKRGPMDEKDEKIYLEGYWQALSDFGIWKSGVQHIGCLETPIKDAFERKRREMEDIREKKMREELL